MARPQSPDYDKRRDAIIAAAAELYGRQGFQGASVADLAKACRTSKSLVYHYFPSKEDILYEVMAAHLELLVGAVDEVAARPQLAPEERLRALALSFMRLYSGAASSHKVLLNELDNLPAERRSDVVAKQRRIIAFVGEQVQAIRPDLADIERPLTMLFFGTINWTHTWFRPGGSVGAEQLGELAVAIVLDGLKNLRASA
jgi:AcrR family transcriptional regulator